MLLLWPQAPHIVLCKPAQERESRCNIVQILVYYPSANFHYCTSGNTNHKVALTQLPSECLHNSEKLMIRMKWRILKYQLHENPTQVWFLTRRSIFVSVCPMKSAESWENGQIQTNIMTSWAPDRAEKYSPPPFEMVIIFMVAFSFQECKTSVPLKSQDWKRVEAGWTKTFFPGIFFKYFNISKWKTKKWCRYNAQSWI